MGFAYTKSALFASRERHYIILYAIKAEDMTRIVFSKQCDHDMDILPFWYHWYTQVFKADHLVITPVKTPLSSIDRVTEFYAKRGIAVIPCSIERWDDEAIWEFQKKTLSFFLPKPNGSFIALSADADQYFEPAQPTSNQKEILYRRVNLYADETPDVDNLSSIEIRAESTFDLISGFTNTLKNTRVGATGHFDGVTPRTPLPREFHFWQRGFEHFHKKVAGIAIETLDGLSAGHWKNWRKKLDTEGLDGLKQEYQKIASRAGNSESDVKLVEQFKECASTLGQSSSQPLECPFSSSIVSKRFRTTHEGRVKEHPVRFPISEADVVEKVLLRQIYMIPEMVRPRCVVDVGAHVGLFSLYAKMLEPNCTVHSFEPVPATHELLLKNTEGVFGVIAYRAALSNYNGESEIGCHLIKSQMDSLTLHPALRAYSRKVQVFDAGLTFETLGLDAIDVLKISAVGSEKAILTSLGKRLEHVKFLLIDPSTKIDQEIVDLLQQYFYCYESENLRSDNQVVRLINASLSPSKGIHSEVSMERFGDVASEKATAQSPEEMEKYWNNAIVVQ